MDLGLADMIAVAAGGSPGIGRGLSGAPVRAGKPVGRFGTVDEPSDFFLVPAPRASCRAGSTRHVRHGMPKTI